jgi:hypothetical protein
MFIRISMVFDDLKRNARASACRAGEWAFEEIATKTKAGSWLRSERQ